MNATAATHRQGVAADSLGRPPDVQIVGLSVDLDGRPVLRGVDIEVAVASRVALVGPNGAGKTTLIRTVAGLVRPARGEVRILGRPFATDPTAARRAVGVSGDQTFLYGELTVRENLLFYARLYRVPDARARADELLEMIGLAGRAGDRVSTLSRGLAQRVSLARAIVQQPSVLLLDEPDAALDAAGLAVLEVVLSSGPRQPAVVLTTHVIDHALRFCDRVAILDRGRIVGEMSASGLDVATLRERYAGAIARRASDEVRDRGRTVSGS